MNDERLHFLFGQYTANRISKAELLELQARLAQAADDAALRQRIAAEFRRIRLDDDAAGDGTVWLQGLETQVWKKITQASADYPARRLFPWRKAIAVAASVLIVATAAIWVFFGSELNRTAKIINLKSEDIAPGGNRATLTLADGRTIDLSEAQTGIVVSDGITYVDGSTVFGERGNEGTSEPVQGSERNHKLTSSPVHKLTTPKGGTYQITLPDGTKVWLNAASTLKYPSRFDEEERIVELIGEAFFDVRHETLDVRHEIANGRNDPVPERHLKSQISSLKSDGRPFWVVSKGQRVEVLGTQFNISAYPDDPETKTTLVEGSVRLSLARELSEAPPVPDKQVILVPGEQGQLVDNAIDVRQVDVTQFIAWRHNQFVFQQTSLHDILQQLQRWYAVEVDLANVPNETFYGRIDRNVPLSAVLDMLADASDYTFEIKERRLTISKK